VRCPVHAPSLRLLVWLTLLVGALCPLRTSAQVLFSEDFDGIPGPTSGGPGTYAFAPGWTLVNRDGRTPAGSVAYVNDAWERREDFNFSVVDSVAFSTSWYSPVGAADDWMITPLIGPLPGNTTLSWNAVAYDPAFRDGYEVRLSTTGATAAACEAGPQLFAVAAENTAWTERSVALDAYQGQSVRLCFHNNSFDKFLLLIDDVVVERVVDFDAELVSTVLPSAYTLIPLSQTRPLTLSGTVRNNGAQPLTNVAVTATITRDGTPVYQQSSPPVASLAPGASTPFTVAGYAPDVVGVYEIAYEVASDQADEDETNDTAARSQAISESVFARDDGTITGQLGIGGGNGGYLGQTFGLVEPDVLSSVTFALTSVSSLVGQEIRVDIFDVAATGAGVQASPDARPDGGPPVRRDDAVEPLALATYTPSSPVVREPAAGRGGAAHRFAPGDPPTTLLGSTVGRVITAEDTLATPLILTLEIEGGPLALDAGDFYLGVVEPDSTLTLGQTQNIFTEGTTWVDWPTNPFGTWANNEDFGASFAKTYVLRANFTAPAIAVTEPVPFGINLTGGLLRVRWTSPDPLDGGAPGLAGPVKVTLHRAGGPSQVLFASTGDDGAQNWPIPAGFAPGPEFTAEVTNVADPAVTGLSHPFAIQTAANHIAVTKPNGGPYLANQAVPIQWTSPAGFPAGADTRLRLLCPGLPPRGIIGGTPNDGAHTWTVPADIAAAEDCRIDVAGRIAAHQPYFGRSPAFDLSDVAYPTLAVTAPGAGASWPRGTTQTVTWVNGGAPIPGDVKVFLVRSGFPRVRLATTPNDGSFAWAIPAGQAPASNYQIHLEGTYNGRKIKGAGSSFSITPALAAGTPTGAVALETGWTRVVWEGGAPTEAGRWLGGLAAEGVTAVAVGARGALVADAAGRYDGVGALAPGEAVEVWVSGPAALAHTASGDVTASAAASVSRYGSPMEGYGAAVLLVSAAGLSDGDEVAAYDRAGTLVGVGVASGGRAALVVRGSSEDGRLASEETEVEVRAPLAAGAALTLRRWAAGAASEDATALAMTDAHRLDGASERAAQPDASSSSVRYADGSVWSVAVDAGAPAAAQAAVTRYALHGAVPNPSTTTTTLRFDVPTAGDLAVEVYDLLGRRVATLVDGRVEAGHHAVRWSSSSVSPGVYVVRMRAGAFVQAQRLTVVR
jgi:hypothetical protein